MWWKKDISAKLYQKCLILCSKILIVLHNLNLTIFLPWQHTGFQTSPTFKAFLAVFGTTFSYSQMCVIYMIQQAFTCKWLVILSLWPCLTFFELKIRVSWHGNRIEHFIALGVFTGELLSLPSFNSLSCKLAKIALFYILDVILAWVYDVISHFICIFYTFFKLYAGFCQQ